MKTTRYLGIDYGEKRIGLAISDPLKIIAKAYEIIGNESYEQVLAKVQEIIGNENIEKLIIGIPYNMNGSIGFQAEEVLAFSDKLKQDIEIPIIYVDERLSSKKSKEILQDMKVKTKRVDDRAAAIILQNYLDY